MSLFFQVEMTQEQGTTSAGFQCMDGDLVLCSRHWTSAEDGSAGDCFFVVGAGRSFRCEPTDGAGTVNVIGAHAAQLNTTAVATGAKAKVRGRRCVSVVSHGACRAQLLNSWRKRVLLLYVHVL